jgi:CCR4-NOT transcription complex subunit 3
VFTPKRYFPTSAMYNRQSNFQRFDVESLFFAFYYMQNTYQQFLAAQELKLRGWDFHIRFQTWIKKESHKEVTRGKSVTKTKTIYFDYENEWRVKTSNGEFNIEDPKFSSQLENEM